MPCYAADIGMPSYAAEIGMPCYAADIFMPCYAAIGMPCYAAPVVGTLPTDDSEAKCNKWLSHSFYLLRGPDTRELRILLSR